MYTKSWRYSPGELEKRLDLHGQRFVFAKQIDRANWIDIALDEVVRSESQATNSLDQLLISLAGHIHRFRCFKLLFVIFLGSEHGEVFTTHLLLFQILNRLQMFATQALVGKYKVLRAVGLQSLCNLLLGDLRLLHLGNPEFSL